MRCCKAQSNLAGQARDRLCQKQQQLFTRSDPPPKQRPAPLVSPRGQWCSLQLVPAASFGQWLGSSAWWCQLGWYAVSDIRVTVLPLSPARRVVTAVSLWPWGHPATPLRWFQVWSPVRPCHGLHCLSAVAHHAQPVRAMPSSWPGWGHDAPVSPEIVEVKFLQLSFASFGTLGLNLSFVIKYRTDETYIYIYIYMEKK